MTAPKIDAGMCGGERPCGGAQLGRVGVEDHRALAVRIFDEAARDPQLEHAFAFGGVIPGVGERIPASKLHALIVV